MKQILIIKNNGESCAFPAETPEEIHTASLYILNLRLSRGLYRKPEDLVKLPFNVYYPRKLEFDVFKDYAKKLLVDQTIKEKDYAIAIDFWDRLMKAVESKDGEMAFEILKERKHKEGERFEFVNFIEIGVENGK